MTPDIERIRREHKAFVHVLALAAGRLFTTRVDLVPLLHRDRQGTLFALSSAPESFSPLRDFSSFEARQVAVNRVITAAKALLNAVGKPVSHRVDHPSLNLRAKR